jgi:hypothetical protein
MADIDGIIEMEPGEVYGETHRGPGTRKYFTIERAGQVIQGQPFSFVPHGGAPLFLFIPDSTGLTVEDAIAKRFRTGAAS